MDQIALLNKIFMFKRNSKDNRNNPAIPPIIPPCPPLEKGGWGDLKRGGRGKITGLTLVEVMIALVIFLFVFFALMQTALVSIDSNMINTLRSEAVNIAEMRMNEARNEPFVSLVSDPNDLSAGGCASADCPTGFSAKGECFPRDVRSISGFKFCTNLTCIEFGGDGICTTDDIGADNKQINIAVGWKWKGENYTHSITTVKTR